jgi:hypothetical protein
MKHMKAFYALCAITLLNLFMAANAQAQAVLNTDVEEFADGVVLVKDKVVPIALGILALVVGIRYGKRILRAIGF